MPRAATAGLALVFVALSAHAAGAIETAVAERAMASVVSVIAKGDRKNISPDEPEGSGVAVLDGRHILTALHVFNLADDIRVRTSDGEILKAKVLGRDRASDLALLHIERALPVLDAGGDPGIGTRVCAIGNAFGLGLALSCGTVSAVHRADTGFNPVEDFVQTDAAVNPGASGGALIDEKGRLVGFLSAIFTKSADANIGVNFAISEPLGMKVARGLRDNVKMAWNFGGAILKQVPAKGAPGRLGGRIVRVSKDTPADKAGLQIDDIVYFAGERRIRKPRDFYSVMARMIRGDSVPVLFERNGEGMTATLKWASDNNRKRNREWIVISSTCRCASFSSKSA
ncbi:MAG: S1C family serine protease [Hyphomicrobiales bacterium]